MNTGGVGSTVVIAIPVLLPGLGSGIVPAAVAALFIIVPCAVPVLTLTTIWKVAVSPLGTDTFEKITLPVPPAGTESVRDHPGEEFEADISVVPDGTGSVTVVLRLDPGPILVKLIV